MYVCSRERFGNVVSSESLRAPASGRFYEKIKDEHGVEISSVQRVAGGKWIASMYARLLPGEYDDRESAIRAVREEAAKPPF